MENAFPPLIRNNSQRGAVDVSSFPLQYEKRQTVNKGNLAARAYYFFDALTWIALLNVAFIGFTVLGGIIFGFSPALIAASGLVRRRAKGETFRIFPAFWKSWKTELVPANILLLPVAVVLAGLTSSWQFFRTAPDNLSSTLAALILAVMAICLTVVSVLIPMVNHYDIRRGGAVPAAISLTLANPLLLILNGLILAGTVLATAQIPGILPFFSFGVAIYLTTRVALDFFVRNEDRLAAVSAPSPTTPLQRA